MTTIFATLGLASIQRDRFTFRKKWWMMKRLWNHLHSAFIRYIKTKK